MSAGTPEAKHPPNVRLTWQRLQRGWSREELVDQIKRSMADHGERPPGLNAEAVRRWENGQRWPEPRYRKHLVLVFGRTASELGLLLPEELALCPENERLENRDQLVDAVVGKVMLMLQGGHVDFDRQLFLRGLLGTSLAPILGRGLPTPGDAEALSGRGRTRTDPRAVAAFEEITAAHRQLYWHSSAGSLFPAAMAHGQLGVGMLRSATGTEESYPRLAAAVAESTLLAARLSFFDLAQPRFAQQVFPVAQQAAEASGDHALSAAVFAHRAFVPGFAGNASAARELLQAAYAHARYDVGPLLRSWLHCVDAEISARTGRAAVSLAGIRGAEDALSSRGTDPQWLDFYDGARLNGFAGNALLLAGRHAMAEQRLRRSLDDLADSASKQRAVILLDLATAQAAADAEQALATAGQACDILRGDGYAAALDRVTQLRAALRSTPYAADLEERVRELRGPAET